MQSVHLIVITITAIVSSAHAQYTDKPPAEYVAPAHQTDERVVNHNNNNNNNNGEKVEDLTDEQLLALLGIGAEQGGLSRCENDQHVCVPYYLCREDSIVTDGAGLIDIRFGAHKQEPSDEPLTHSECPNYIEVCCAAPIEKENLTEKYQPQCGKRNELGINARIVGFKDREAQFGEFPWMAAVLRKTIINEVEKNLYVCGGALIHPQVILTAAHCVHKHAPETLRVRLGEWDTVNTHEFLPHVDADVGKVIVSPCFNDRNLRCDFALLFLAEPVELQDHIDTLCLPDPTVNYDWSQCVATGWGKDRFNNGSYQTVLKQVELQRVNRSTCQDRLRTTRLGQYFKLDESFTCASGKVIATQDEYGNVQYDESVADTCTGDGGSPLACISPNDPYRYVHGGIVAWGIGCGEKGIPGVYADTSKAVEWIDSVVTREFYLEHSYYGFDKDSSTQVSPTVNTNYKEP